MSALHASDFFTKGRIMTGKTHAAVGLGTVLAVTQPSTVSGLVLAAGTGMLGALISVMWELPSPIKMRIGSH